MIGISNLTDEQRAVVDHGEGPALVYAVAGAGKTTSMVYRIQALVRDRGVERVAMLKYGIDDIRLLYDNDVRFLRQF